MPQTTFLQRWINIELLLSIALLLYFLGYNRDTCSDFIVCSSLSLLLLLFGNRLQLSTPIVAPFGTADWILTSIAVLAFTGAWFYGYYHNKINPNSALTAICITGIYFYYAWIQHFLAQRYLALRMQRFCREKSAPDIGAKQLNLRAACCTGLVFGLLHIIYPHLILVSTIGGMLFAYYYLTTGRLWMVVVGHSLIASANLFWVLDDNPFTEIVTLPFGY